MKKLTIKYLLTVICMLAAGICYSCSKETNQVDLDGRVLVMDLQAEQVSQEAGVQNGLISAKTEAGEDSPDEPETGSGEEPLPWQTESVRFYVHICGEVVNPGVYEMEPGSRIFQVVEAAGGFTAQAASDYLNMAQETADGMKITVPSGEEIESLEALEPGSLGIDIIRYREEQGPFRTIEEVMNISGIKEAAFEKIKDDITV